MSTVVTFGWFEGVLCHIVEVVLFQDWSEDVCVVESPELCCVPSRQQGLMVTLLQTLYLQCIRRSVQTVL